MGFLLPQKGASCGEGEVRGRTSDGDRGAEIPQGTGGDIVVVFKVDVEVIQLGEYPTMLAMTEIFSWVFSISRRA